MFKVKTGIQSTWKLKEDEFIVPPFPAVCCICGVVADTFAEKSELDGKVKFLVPYCPEHLTQSKIYHDKIISSKTLSYIYGVFFIVVWIMMAGIFIWILTDVFPDIPSWIIVIGTIILSPIIIMATPLLLSLARFPGTLYLRSLAAKHNIQLLPGQNTVGPGLGIAGLTATTAADNSTITILVGIGNSEFMNLYKALQPEETNAHEIVVA